MAKIGNYIALYLQENSTLNLEGIGKLFRDESADVVETTGKELVRPISLAQNNSATTDESFINFMKEKTGKMRSLILSDVETYMVTGKQLLNISKPFSIEGFGTILRDSKGVMTFEMGDYMPPKIGVAVDRERKNKPQKESVINELDYESTYGKSVIEPKKIGRKILAAGLIFCLIAGVGYALYALVFSKMNDVATATSTTEVKTNEKDTTKKTPQAIQAAPLDSLGRSLYKLVVRNTTEAAAMQRAKALDGFSLPIGYDTTIVEKDKAGTNFNVIVLIRSKATDTAALRIKFQKEYGTDGQTVTFTQ